MIAGSGKDLLLNTLFAWVFLRICCQSKNQDIYGLLLSVHNGAVYVGGGAFSILLDISV